MGHVSQNSLNIGHIYVTDNPPPPHPTPPHTHIYTHLSDTFGLNWLQTAPLTETYPPRMSSPQLFQRQAVTRMSHLGFFSPGVLTSPVCSSHWQVHSLQPFQDINVFKMTALCVDDAHFALTTYKCTHTLLGRKKKLFSFCLCVWARACRRQYTRANDCAFVYACVWREGGGVHAL